MCIKTTLLSPISAKVKHLIIFLLLVAHVCKGYGQYNDSIFTGELQEVIVKSKRAWIEKGTVNVIPTKTEKKLSNSPASLINSMNLPFLTEKDGRILNIAGEELTIFINGEKANAIDLSTFWPMEVKKIQYIKNSTDPAFEGYRNVINFIMSKYEIGGVTKVNLFQKVPNNGFFDVSSKAVYKRMTYGIMVWGSYLNDHRSEMKGETEYKDIYYQNKKYNLITRNEEQWSYEKNNTLRTAFNAKYSTDKVRLTHTFSFGWSNNPGSGSNSINYWSENIFNSLTASDFKKSSHISPQISGDYSFKLASKWTLKTFWQYAYTRNKNYSFSQIGDNDPIYNQTFENVHSAKISISPIFIPTDNWYFQFKTSADLNWFATNYYGSADLYQTQSRQDISSDLSIDWNPSESVSISLNPGVKASLWQIGDIRQYTVNPTATANIDWTINSKLNIGGDLEMYMQSPSPSESNPVLIRESELLWSEGNPYLKTLTTYSANLYSNYIPMDWMSLSASLSYDKTFDNQITSYQPAPIEKDGLIKSIMTSSPSDRYHASISLKGGFFNNQLSVRITPAWTYYFFRTPYRNHLGNFRIEGNADYTIRNFRFSLRYEPSFKLLNEGGMEKSWGQGKWNASLTYGTGAIFIRFGAEDIFNNKERSWSQFISQYYETKYDYLKNGRRFFLNLTYSFSYGKKVDRRININGPVSTETSVR